MPEIFGDYVDLAHNGESLKIAFSSSLLPIHRRWRTNGLSADFLADYCCTFLPSNEQTSPRRQADIKNLIAYVANELLENSMKFAHEPHKHTVSIHISLLPAECYFYVSNCVDPDAVESFQAYLRRLLHDDPGELYVRQLEMNARNGNDGVSRLGFLTMLCDYHARLAWKFTTCENNPKVVFVTTMACLDLHTRP